MLRIRHKDTFLKLAPGSTVEMERSSPLFLIDNVTAEFSMPVTILYEDSNVALLGDNFFEYGIKSKLKIDVDVYDNETFRYRCVMIIDKTITNKFQPGKGNVQGFLLTGYSDFFNSVKEKKVVDYELGGGDTFAFTTWDPFDSSDGFWQKIHETWTNPDFDYVFVPIRNEAWINDETFSGWMNQLGVGEIDGGAISPSDQIIPFTWPVPQPKLKNTLHKLFAEIGWTLNTDGLNDSHWEKIILLNINPIKTTYQSGTDGLGIPIISPVANIKIELRKMFSPEVTVKAFILEHCKRYGWAPIFDSDSKTCYLIALKEVSLGATTKDFTAYAGPIVDIDYSADNRKYSFKNTFTGNDESISSPDFTNFTFKPPVFRKSALPTPSAEYDNSLIFSFYENAWWKISVNTELNEREWTLHAYNIYDEEIKNSTDDFNTEVTVIPAILTKYSSRTTYVLASPVLVDYYGLFPYCKQPRNKQWGMRNLFYFGMVSDIKEDGSGGTYDYPYAGETIVLPDGTISDGWSNVWVHQNGTTNYGIINYWFKNWIKILKVNTPIERRLYLPHHELENLKWDDIINIINQPFLIQKYIDPIPYKGYILATLHPLILNEIDLVSSSPTDDIVYVKFIWEDDAAAPDVDIYGTIYWTNVRRAKPIIRCFAEAAGITPKTPVGLRIALTELASSDDITFNDFDQYSVILNAAVTNLAENELVSETNATNNRPSQPDLKYQRVGYSTLGSMYLYQKYRVNAGTGYIVI
jgi:hypothetical protein